MMMVPSKNDEVKVPCRNNNEDVNQPSLTRFGSFGYSWSRSPRRNIKFVPQDPVTTEVITGTATIVFHEYGDIFEGCLASQYDTYSFKGTRKYQLTQAKNLQPLNLSTHQQNRIEKILVDEKYTTLGDGEETGKRIYYGRRDIGNNNKVGMYIVKSDVSKDVDNASSDDRKVMKSVTNNDSKDVDRVSNDDSKEMVDSKDMEYVSNDGNKEFDSINNDGSYNDNRKDMGTASSDLESNVKIYNVNLFDFQTSIHHTLGEVRCNLQSNKCSMESETVKFMSSLTYRGAAANKVILQNIGPCPWSPNFHVFQGEMSIKLEDFIVRAPVKYTHNSHSAYAQQLRTQYGIID